jgi:hypothetical protein
MSGRTATAGELAQLPDWRTKAPPRGGAGNGKGIREICASPLGGKARQRFAARSCQVMLTGLRLRRRGAAAAEAAYETHITVSDAELPSRTCVDRKPAVRARVPQFA